MFLLAISRRRGVAHFSSHSAAWRIIAEIEKLNVLELVELTKTLQEKWGVSAAPVAAAAAAATAGDGTQAATTFGWGPVLAGDEFSNTGAPDATKPVCGGGNP